MLAALRRWSRRRLPNWMRGSLEPDEHIGRHGMRRWWIFRTPWLALYLHHSTRDDERLLHDHPAWNISVRLAGQLLEEIPYVGTDATALELERVSGDLVLHRTRCGGYMAFVNREPYVRRRFMPRVVVRRAAGIHRLTVPGTGCWTLWLRGPSSRPDDWGFYAPELGWVPWRDGLAYMDAEDWERANASHG